jgi:hypothetical protein
MIYIYGSTDFCSQLKIEDLFFPVMVFDYEKCWRVLNVIVYFFQFKSLTIVKCSHALEYTPSFRINSYISDLFCKDVVSWPIELFVMLQPLKALYLLSQITKTLSSEKSSDERNASRW